MPAARADLSISSRWILPMGSSATVLEHHSLVVRDGRILDLLPSTAAAVRYSPTVTVERGEHALIPGLVNAYARLEPAPATAQHADHAARLAIADMLKTGTTCCCIVGADPPAAARTAGEVGIRAVIGMPIGDEAGPWARGAAEYVTRALALRDEYRGHRTISTVFAPLDAAAIGDATFRRIATLAAELDAGVLLPLHESAAAIDRSIARFGARPIERLAALGLLTPALIAVHMMEANEADVSAATRDGIAVVVCPESDILAGYGPHALAAWESRGSRLGIGTDTSGFDLWRELRLFGLAACARPAERNPPGAWAALGAATRGGAAVLGLESEIGTLEPGKWADCCAVGLGGAAMLQRLHEEPAVRLAFRAGRELVTDVWVAGRHLLDDGEFTRSRPSGDTA